MVAEIRNAIRALDPTLPVYDARTVSEHMQVAVFAQRMAANLLGAMGVLALLLAAIGLYGVMAYAVSQRTQEMGIRLALGASPSSLLNMIVGQGMKLTDDRPGRSAWRWRLAPLDRLARCGRCCQASRRSIRSRSSRCH